MARKSKNCVRYCVLKSYENAKVTYLSKYQNNYAHNSGGGGDIEICLPVGTCEITIIARK